MQAAAFRLNTFENSAQQGISISLISRYYYRCSSVSRRTCNTKMQRADILEAEVPGILLEALREHPSEPIPVMDVERAAELVAQFGRTIDEATPDEKRSIIRQMFSRVWVADKHIEAITPTVLFHPMLEAARELQQEEGVHLGCLTGLEPTTL
jgi:hypothetical protein